MCRRGARMELRPPEPRPLQLAPPLGHESSLSAYRAWFVEVVLTASGVPELVAESMRVIEECASEAGKFYRRWERLADQSTWPTLGPNRHFALPQVPPYTARRQHGSCTIQPVHSGVPGACGQRPAAGGACCLFVRQSNQASLAPCSCEVCRCRGRDHISDSSTRCSRLGNARHQECHPRTGPLYLPGANRTRQPPQAGQTKSVLRLGRSSWGKPRYQYGFPALRGPTRVLLSSNAYGQRSRSSDLVRELADPLQRFARRASRSFQTA